MGPGCPLAVGRGKEPCSSRGWGGLQGQLPSGAASRLVPGLGPWCIDPVAHLQLPPTPPLCTTGISGKSQVLFAVVFTARYLDLFTNYISLYNTCMKVKAS